MRYEPLTFDIPELEGMSRDTIDNHLGLYRGYVKHVNLIQEKIESYSNDFKNNSFAISEMQRRLGFEFGGMRNHEYYFSQFEGGAKNLPEGSLKTKLEQQWGTFDNWFEHFRQIANTRGVGWAMLYHDPHTDQLIQTWVDEQQIGQLADLDIILALDMWEHSYMRDYTSSDKGKYVDAFFRNLNWEVVSERLV
ncbi:superoxide dismutase [Candidatus Kaiserbacteria bacterium]|nr:superoxide dismutase [Candidatus Kaiserbacteria bacterium]USN92468.1 MAG: superoxide dismutase [Candidatus Nomurabacteria bacterium]